MDASPFDYSRFIEDSAAQYRGGPAAAASTADLHETFPQGDGDSAAQYSSPQVPMEDRSPR